MNEHAMGDEIDAHFQLGLGLYSRHLSSLLRPALHLDDPLSSLNAAINAPELAIGAMTMKRQPRMRLALWSSFSPQAEWVSLWPTPVHC